MDKKKLEKGMYGFHNKKKTHEIIKTILFFGIALAVYFTGLLHTGTNQNLLTIVAIVGVLPASKSAVNMLMFVRYRQSSAELHRLLCEADAGASQADICQAEQELCKGIVLYDLIFVLNEKVVKTDCIYIKDTFLTVYTAQDKMPKQDISRCLRNFLANHGKGKVSVKVCTKEEEFLEQVKSRMYDEVTKQTADLQSDIRDMLFGFSM